MRNWYRERRARRQVGKVKPGDGSQLKPHRWWQFLQRSLFSIELVTAQGPPEVYTVDVDLFDEQWRAFLYTDGAQSAVSTLPAAFPVPGGRIEVATTMYGLKRIHLVREDGSEQVLTPDPKSAEGRRLAVDQRWPGLSKVIAVAAIVVLLTSLVVGLPAVLEAVTQWDVVAERVGTYTSPFDLPSWVNTTLFVAAIVAATERALTLRNHWLIDLDTTLFGD